MNTVKTNVQGLVKDMDTGVITNVGTESLLEYKGKVNKIKEMKRMAEQILDLKDHIRILENRINEIDDRTLGLRTFGGTMGRRNG